MLIVACKCVEAARLVRDCGSGLRLLSALLSISSLDGLEGAAGWVCAVASFGVSNPYDSGDNRLIAAAAIRSVFPARRKRTPITLRMIFSTRRFKFPPETPEAKGSG